jgi:hypothetical protein
VLYSVYWRNAILRIQWKIFKDVSGKSTGLLQGICGDDFFEITKVNPGEWMLEINHKYKGKYSYNRAKKIALDFVNL